MWGKRATQPLNQNLSGDALDLSWRAIQKQKNFANLTHHLKDQARWLLKISEGLLH